jgi:threonine synthase
VFCPADTPEINVREIALAGAHVTLVDGLINDCGKRVAEGRERMGWFDVSTLKEPYRIEGKKTMGIELAEQLGWTLPDVIFYPTGGGTGLIGHVEGIRGARSRRPPRARRAAHGRGRRRRDARRSCAPSSPAPSTRRLWPDAHTIAAGIRVPAAIGDFLILRAVRESGGLRDRRWTTRRSRRRSAKVGARGGPAALSPRAQRPMPPGGPRSPTAGSARMKKYCSSTAPPASSTPSPRSPDLAPKGDGHF